MEPEEEEIEESKAEEGAQAGAENGEEEDSEEEEEEDYYAKLEAEKKVHIDEYLTTGANFYKWQ